MDNETKSIDGSILEEWNKRIADVMIPNNVILSLYVLMGITGNSIIIFVYGFRMKGKKDDRYFIPFLAAVDLFASTVCASFGIASNLLQVKFKNADLCKVWWYFGTVATLMSAQMLLIIAIQRYRKICKPLEKQMTTLWKRISMGLSLCIALITAVPMVYFYGSVPFPNVDGTIIGLSCNIFKDRNEIEWILYGGALGILAIGIAISLIVIYMKVGYKIYNHFKTLSSKGKNLEEKSVNCEEIKYSSNSESVNTKTSKNSTENEELSAEESRKFPVSKNEKIKCTPGKPMTSSHDKRNKRIMYKVTLMFMLVTFFFLICYTPKIILMFFEGTDTLFWEQFSDSERAGVLFVYRMFIINNIVNPIIYGFMDNEFRMELCKLCYCQRK